MQMQKSPLIQAKLELGVLMEGAYKRLNETLILEEGLAEVALAERFRHMQKEVWTVIEKCMKLSYRNGVSAGRLNTSLLEVTHFMCARLTAMAEIMAARHDWSYGRQVIAELSETLQRMPFTDEEGAFVHRTLEPIVRAYGGRFETVPPSLKNDWMRPILDSLENVPGKQPLTTDSV